MKTYVKRIIGGAVLSIALVTYTVPTWAGNRDNREVIVGYIVGNATGGATGGVNAARYSSDSKQYIGCIIRGTTSYSSVTCFAADKTGATFACSTTDPNMIKTVRTMTNYSFLRFFTGADRSTCDGIEVFNYSDYLK